MFERQVAYYLNKYLGRYVYNVDASALKISILRGNVELHNLRLKPEALNELNLPITVKSGLLGSLKLKVPWANLGGEPVICELDSIYVLAVPNTGNGDTHTGRDTEEAAEQANKRQKVDEEEREFIRAWKQSLDIQAEKQSQTKSKGDPEGGHPGRLQYYIETILGNLQICVTNVHVRYEDAESVPGEVFTCGLTLEEASAYTVDANNKRTFVSRHALDHLRKTATLRRLAFYFDVGSSRWTPPTKEWKSMARSHWDQMFLPSVRGEGSQNCPKHQYILAPVHGQLNYDRISGKQRQKLPESHPTEQAELSLLSVDVGVQEGQYKCVQALLEAISMHKQRLPHMHLRPRSRPLGHRAVCRWWQYAMRATIGEGASGKGLSWEKIQAACRVRREYIPLYVACLTAGQVGGNERIRQLDKDLSIAVIIHFRKTAHMKVEKQKRLEAMKKREQQLAAGEQRGWFSFMGWSPGGGGGQPRESNAQVKKDPDAELNEDEMAQLEELAEEQNRVLEEAQKTATPFTVLKFLKVTVSSCSVALSDTSGMEVIKASMNSSSVQSKFYSKTIEAKVQIGEIKAWSFDDELLTSNMKSVGKREVLALHLIHSPQDGRADDVINLVVNPTYVTYDGTLLERMLAFVHRNQNVNLGAIGAQAGAMADSVAAEVKTKVTAAWEARQTPRLLLNLTMEAPRIALPLRHLSGATFGKAADGTEEVLVFDLGLFQLQSDSVTAGKLSEAEARVYECFVLKGSRVQASSNHIQAPFSWERWEEARPQMHPSKRSGRQSRSLPLVDPIELYCEFQFAKFMHPTFPSLRSKLTLPRLQFHISPARISRIMSLASDFMGGGGASTQLEPAWMKEVDFAGDVRLLSWKGLTWSNAVWEERWGALWYGWLYVMEGRDSFTVIRSASIFNQHTLKVPPEAMDGMENVVAICNESRLSQHVLEDPSTVILQFKSSPEAASWLWRIHLAKQRMAALLPASMLHNRDEVLGQKDHDSGKARHAAGADQPSSAGSGTEGSAAPVAPPGGISTFASNAEADPESTIRDRASKVTMVTAIDVGVFQLWVSGRTMDTWWPKQDYHQKRPERFSFPSESPLIVLDGQGMHLELQMSATHTTSAASLASLMIHDELVGPQRSDCRHLAVSNKLQLLEDLPSSGILGANSAGWSPQKDGSSYFSASGSRSLHAHHLSDIQKSFKSGAGSEEEFFDVQEAMSVASQSSETPANPNALTQRDPTSTPGLLEDFDLGEDAPEAQESSKLARLTFKMWKPESPLYDGVDVEVSMKLATLFFYCNRPTVAALMALGPDMNAAIGSNSADTGVDAKLEESGGRNGAALDTTSIVKGAENRVTFRLLAEMQTLEATLNYEGTDAFPLLEASMQHFSFNLDMKPSTLSLESKLGNLVAHDRSFGHEYLFSTICDLRPEGGIDSLIELQYSTYKGNAMPNTNGRMPPRTDFAWLKAKLNAVDIVFLNRQLQELLAYIDGLLLLQPSPVETEHAVGDAVESISQSGSGRSTPRGRKASRTHSRRSSRELFDFVHSRLSFSGDPREDESSFSGGGRKPSRRASSGTAGKALMLLMDVDMRAPVITMPLSSFSDDEIEVDLGHFHLANRVVPEACGGHTVLMDVIDIKVDGITTSTTVSGERNSGLVRFQEGVSLRTTVRRMLNGPEHIVPGLSIDISIPEVNVDLKDKEFHLITAIAASNLNEQVNIPPGVKQLQQELKLHSDSQQMANPSPIFEDAEWMEPGDESSWPSIKVTVQLSATRLVLLTTSGGVSDGCPLASMLVPGMSVDYKASASGMSVLVAIPNIIVTDLRQSTPENSRVVMASSSGQHCTLSEADPKRSPPSMIVLQYITYVHDSSQVLNTRLQRPTFVAEMGFVMSLFDFVSPPKEELQEYMSGDLLLKSEITRAKADLWLSPDCRLLADGPFSDDYLLDGCGMRLVLPPRISQSEPLPLILVGSGKTLRLVNFDIVNSSSLSGCLLLGHGGQMVALPEDGITMTSEDSFEVALPKANGDRKLIPKPSTSDMETRSANRPGSSITLNLTALGVSLNFLDMVRSDAGVVDALQADAPEASVDATGSKQGSYMLTTSLDFAMTYSLMASGDQQLEADLHDVLVRAYLDGASKQGGDGSIFTLEPPGGNMDNTGSNTLLQPCDVSFKYGTQNKVTDIQLSTSDIVVTMGIDMLDVLARLQDRVLGPMYKPPPDRPVAAAMTFAKVWPQTSEQLSGMPPYSNTRDVDLFEAERGFTVWRPQVPFGYLSLGDVITQGNKLPRHHAACIAKESGLTALPLDYQLVLREGDLHIWTPVPPDGFVSMGCVCSTSEAPPPPGTITCVRSDVVVQTAPGECLCMRIRSCGSMKRSYEEPPAIEQLRLWTVANSPGTFVSVVQDSDEVSIPSGICFDLRSPLGSIPQALHMHMTEAISHGNLKAPSPNVVRHELSLVEPSESGGEESTAVDLDASSVAQEYEVLEWDVALQRELAFAFVRRDHNLRNQRTRDHECIEVAEFQKLWMYDNKTRRVSFWRPLVPAGYIYLGDCMSFNVHPPKLASVFLDDSQDRANSEELPKFAKPIKFKEIWKGTSFHQNRPGEKEIVSLWEPVPPALYTAIGWVAWTGRQPPTSDTCAMRCIRSTLVDLMNDAEEEKVLWPLPGSKHERGKQKDSIAMWNSNHYTWTFWGNREQSEMSGRSTSISWDISLLNDALTTSRHASGLEDPHYKITLDLGLISVMVLDMTREPLVEMNLGKAEALQGRSAFSHGRSERHCKRPGVSAHMRETAPGLLQAFSELSLELWSYNKTRWEPVLEPFVVLVHFDHNSRSRVVSTLRPGTHVTIKSTSDEGLHLTVAHAALDSILRAFEDASKVMEGSTTDLLASAHKSAQYAYVQNQLGVALQALLDYGQQTASATLSDGKMMRILLPRANQYQRKLPEPPSAPKGFLMIHVSRLDMKPDAHCQGTLFVSVALVPAHELDQCMTVQTRWRKPVKDNSRRSVDWQEQLILKLPDDEVTALSNLRWDNEDNSGSEASIILQVAVHDVAARAGRGGRVAAGMVQLTHGWLLKQLSNTDATAPLSCRVKLTNGGDGGEVWGDVGVAVALEWSSRGSTIPSTSEGGVEQKGNGDSTVLASARMRLNGDDPWSPLSSINAVRRGAGDSAALAAGSDLSVATTVRPVIVTPVTVLSNNARRCFAIEESIEAGVRNLVARSLCQITNHTGVTLKVGLVPRNGGGGSQRQRDASILHTIQHSKQMTSSIVDGVLQMSVVEVVYENQRHVRKRGFGAKGYLTEKDERDGHKRYEWRDMEDKPRSDWNFPSIQLPPGWEWASDWVQERGHQDQDSEGFIYGSTWNELVFPPAAGIERQCLSGVRRRKFTRRRVLSQSAAEDVDEGVELLGSIPPFGRLPLPLNWDEGEMQVVLRPEIVDTEDKESETVVMQLCKAAHRWSICITGDSSGIDLTALQGGKTQLMACPPSRPSQGAVQLATPGKSLRKFTAFQGTVFWMSAQAVANPFQSSNMEGGVVDWEIVVSPPLVVENLLPVNTDFFIWEKPHGGSTLKLRCEGALHSGGSVQVHSVDMRNEVHISVAPDTCNKEAEPVMLSPGIDARQNKQLPISFDVHHTGHACKSPLTLFMERRACAKNADTDPRAMASIAQGSKLTVSLYAGLIVLNGTQLPLYVATERGKPRRREDKQPMGSIPMGDQEDSLPVEETLGIVRGYQCAPEGCKFPPGTVQMMSFPINSEHEYSVKVALDGSSWAGAMSLENEVPTPPWLLRAHIGGTQQIHEVVVSLVPCTGAFGRSQLLKLDPHIVVTNLTGLPLHIRQCTHPKPVVRSGASKLLQAASSKKAVSPFGGEQVARTGTRATKAQEEGSKEAVKHVKSRLHSALSSRVKNTKGRKLLSMPSSSDSRHETYQRPQVVSSRSVQDWETDNIGVMNLPPNSVAVPMYWSESCWQKSVCVSLVEDGGPQRLSSPIQLALPGFEEQYISIPTAPRSSSLSRASSQASLASAAGGGGDGGGCPFAYGSVRAAGTKLRTALAGSPLCRQLGADNQMQECYSDEESLVLRVSATVKRFNCLHLTFHSVTTAAPAAVDNRSANTVLFRKDNGATRDPEWQIAHPWTCVPVVWDSVTMAERAVELLELGLAERGATRRYYFHRDPKLRHAGSGSVEMVEANESDPQEGEASEGSTRGMTNTPAGSVRGTMRGISSGWAVLSPDAVSAEQPLLPTSGTDGSLMVQLDTVGRGFHPMAAGSVVLGGGTVSSRALGLCGRPQHLVVLPKSKIAAESSVFLSTQLNSLPTRLYLLFLLPSIQVSVVDHTPQELVLLSVDGLVLEYSMGLGVANTMSYLYLKVKEFQADNMLPYTRYPVFMAQVTARDERAEDPVLEVVFNAERSQDMAHIYYPYISASVGKTLVLNMCEALVWNALGMYKNLSLPSGGQSQTPANVQADSTVEIKLLTLGALKTRLSFGTAPDARGTIDTGSVGYLISLAAFKDLPFAIDGCERTDLQAPRSIFMENMMRNASNHVFNLAFRILRSSVSLHSASRAIGGVSSQVAKLSMDDEYREIRDQQTQQEARHLGEGLAGGGEAFAKSVLWGFTGIVRRPWQGAQQNGAVGFMEGLGTGMVGAVVQPVSGLLDLVSKTAEGAGATMDKATKVITGDDIPRPKTRRRLPRAISGDQCLQPFNKEAAQGQMLLWSAKRAPGMEEIINMRFRMVRVAKYKGDKYEAHIKLPASRYALITNTRVMLLTDTNKGAGSSRGSSASSGSNEVVLEWECEWEDVLSLQLKRDKSASTSDPPNRLILYRKEGSADGVMQHEWRCEPRSAQAEQLLEMVQSARLKYSESFRRIRSPVSRQNITTSPPSHDVTGSSNLAAWSTGAWKLIWRSYSGAPVSIWRPVAHEGYHVLGDVLTVEAGSPDFKVLTLRHEEGDERQQAGLSQGGNSRGGPDFPVTAQPISYWLVWRTLGKGSSPSHIANGEGPLSLWLPVAPNDRYRTLGCVAMSSLEEPPLDLGRCVRRDLLDTAELEDKVVWKGMASDKTSWRCSMSRIVDSSAHTFFASRNPASGGFRFYRPSTDVVQTAHSNS